MKKLGYIICLIAVLGACKDTTRFTIKGKFENAGQDRKVYLYGMTNNSMAVLDSTTLSEKGEFTFTRPGTNTDFYRVNIGDTHEYMTIAENGDVVELTANLADPNNAYEIKGAAEADKLTEFNKLKNGYTAKIETIKSDFQKKADANPDQREALVQEMSPKYMAALQELNTAIAKFALDNPKSLVSFYAISLLNPSGNEAALVSYAEKVDDELKKNQAVKAFVDKVTKLKAVQVGQMAPDFSINTIDGKTIKLSDFKGKYTLIDFWASWCAPCRSENPNIVKAYQQFKDKNFTILGISLDKDKAAWAQAIKQDGLTWTHASELNDFNGASVRLYQVEAIPSSFLLDPNGKIIARNLRGDELTAFLTKSLR
jgi:peroxiredoxin